MFLYSPVPPLPAKANIPYFVRQDTDREEIAINEDKAVVSPRPSHQDHLSVRRRVYRMIGLKCFVILLVVWSMVHRGGQRRSEVEVELSKSSTPAVDPAVQYQAVGEE